MSTQVALGLASSRNKLLKTWETDDPETGKKGCGLWISKQYVKTIVVFLGKGLDQEVKSWLCARDEAVTSELRIRGEEMTSRQDW
jgi:hypothetical protein